MVSWVGDGLINGMTRTGGHAVQVSDAYHLVAGVVDAQANTRLQFPIPGSTLVNDNTGFSSTYNGIRAQATITFASGDIPSGWVGTIGLFTVQASRFSPGYTPTAQEILSLRGVSAFGNPNVAGTGTNTFVAAVSGASLISGSKYWVLVVPVIMKNDQIGKPSPSFSVVSGSANTYGRAISVWTNRQPLAPSITSPTNGSVIDGGDTFSLSFVPNDPDGVFTSTGDSDPHIFNDLAGVQVQYAPQPTSDNSSPSWIDLPFVTKSGSTLSSGPGWYLSLIHI